VRFQGRVRGRQLPAGTYRIEARTRGGSTVLSVTVVIVDSGAPSPTELETAKRSNVCGARAALASSVISGGAAAAAAAEPANAAEADAAAPTENGSVAAASHTRASPFSPKELSKHATDPLVIAVLALAAMLLGVASLPVQAIPNARLTHSLANNRLELAAMGVTALAAALIALAFS
jgi:hypothetical protein